MNNSLLHIFIKSFRNMSETTLDVSPKLNLLVGQNGQGKTNCLEAIALACSLRPLQSLANVDLIKYQNEKASINASFQDFELKIEIMPQGKKATMDGKALKNARSLAERIPVVSFIPQELLMISGSASLRRRALDLAAGSLYFDHFTAVKDYEKTLSHRNRLLKSWPPNQKMLNIFSEMLIAKGALIMHTRLRILEELKPHFCASLADILGFNYQGSLAYESDESTLGAHTEADLKALLHAKKERYYQEEKARKVTLFGPHLDDLNFLLNGINAKGHASRGQMRAMVLAFKLAHMILVHRLREQAPIVILDDIVSELDDLRKANLIDVITRLNTQAFFSAVDLNAFGPRPQGVQIFALKDGDSSKISS